MLVNFPEPFLATGWLPISQCNFILTFLMYSHGLVRVYLPCSALLCLLPTQLSDPKCYCNGNV